MAVTKQETFITTDGSYFFSYEQAVAHDALYNKCKLLQGLLDGYVSTLDPVLMKDALPAVQVLFKHNTYGLAKYLAKHIGEVH